MLDTSRNAEHIKHTWSNVEHGANNAGNAYEVRSFIDSINANYNKGYAVRKAL